jgi:hypothetical protein
MSSHNISVVRGFNDALAQGDMGGMLDFLDPQLEWRAPRVGALGRHLSRPRRLPGSTVKTVPNLLYLSNCSD